MPVEEGEAAGLRCQSIRELSISFGTALDRDRGQLTGTRSLELLPNSANSIVQEVGIPAY